MTRFSSFAPLLTTALAMSFSACQADLSENNTKSGSWCISGGTIYSANDANEAYAAVAVHEGKISYAGDDTDNWCAEHAGDNAHNLDLAGGALYPGLTDSHGHLLGIGLREMTLNLEGTTSIVDLQERVKAAIADTPEGEVIYGRGWIETHWPEARFPTKADLDSVAPNHAIILERSDGHAAVVNSLTLQRAQITADTPAPFGGAINKGEDGEPNGMLIDYAFKLVEPLLPQLTDERKEAAYIKGAELYASLGWTNIHSMSVNPVDIPLINRLAAQGKIKIRIYNSLDVLDQQTLAGMDKMKALESDLVTTRAIKLYADGALGSRGAALLAPYSDDEKNSGLMLLKDEQARSILQAALINGTQVNTHAIGDRANRLVLDWYEAAFEAVPPKQRAVENPRWRIEHSQIIEPSDIDRFAKLGVIASMQPSHAIGDLHFAPARLGDGRLVGAYAWQALIDSGAIIAAGSDAPVEVGDPRIEFYAATQRMDLKGFSAPNWQPGQKVSADNALKMFTAWPAYASFTDEQLGTIVIGKTADFSAFDRDLMTASGPDILSAKVLFTMVDGKLAYQAD